MTFGKDDIDYTWCDYTIVIMNSKNFQIKSILIDNVIEAENMFFFGNNILYSFGLRSFYSLNLKFLQNFFGASLLSLFFNTFFRKK